MAYYDALIAKWGTLTGTAAQKLAAVNALTVPGPNVDVPVSAVVGKLMLSGVYLKLGAFAQSAGTGDVTRDTALGAAKLLMALITTPNAPALHTSDTADYATIKGMADALLAQELVQAGSTGITQTVHDALLALATGQQLWRTANGYPELSINDVVAAGLS